MLEERQRLLQDLHDGMGHELLGALLLARSRTTPRKAVAAQIERAMDCLKLTVDAMQPGAHDPGTILGSLRHRIARRLELAGIALDWQAARIPPVAGWTPAQGRELQMLLYEAFTNLVRHSGARRARLRAGVDARQGGLRVVLQDDGRGLPADAAHGQGLGSMRARAARMSATLSYAPGDAEFPGARLELHIPARPEAPAH